MSFLQLEQPIYLKGPVALLKGKKITNEDLIEWMEECSFTPASVNHTSGIQSRYWVSPEYTCSALAVEVGQKLFASKDQDKNKIGQLILATTSGDFISPPTSPLVQYQLKLPHVGA